MISGSYVEPCAKGCFWTFDGYRVSNQCEGGLDCTVSAASQQTVLVCNYLSGVTNLNLHKHLSGLKVAESRKRKWDGNLQDIDEDFVRFVDSLCQKTFGDIRTQQVLGQDLAPQSFAKVVETLACAFSGMEVSQMSMVRDSMGLTFCRYYMTRELPPGKFSNLAIVIVLGPGPLLL